MVTRNKHTPDATCVDLIQTSKTEVHSIDIDTVSVVMEITKKQNNIAIFTFSQIKEPIYITLTILIMNAAV
jgi:hypothetical protein